MLYIRVTSTECRIKSQEKRYVMDPSDVRQSTDIWGRQIQTTILCIEKLRAINFWEFLPPLYPESYTFLRAN